MTNDDPTYDIDDTTNSISRRTIVKSAAWSVPVIATVIAIPTATASGIVPPSLGLTPTSTCTAITEDIVVTVNGAPLQTASITIALQGGYQFIENGDAEPTTWTEMTDENGRVVDLPAINIPTDRATGSLTVTYDGQTSEPATLEAPTLARSYWMYAPSAVKKPLVPPGSTPFYGDYFLSEDGWIYASNGIRLATQQKPINPNAVGRALSLGSWVIGFTYEDGSNGTFNNDTLVDSPSSLDGAIPLFGGWFLLGEHLYKVNGDPVEASNPAITEPGQPLTLGAVFLFPVKRDGVLGWYTNSGTNAVFVAATTTEFPADAAPYFGNIFIDFDGQLYNGTAGMPDGGKKLLTLSAGIFSDTPRISETGDSSNMGSIWHLPTKTVDGDHLILSGTTFIARTTAIGNIAPTAVPAYGTLFWDPNEGTIIEGIYGTDMTPPGEKIIALGQAYENGGTWYPFETEERACS